MFSATIFFRADPSVGSQSFYFDMEIPDWRLGFDMGSNEEKVVREETRMQIKDLYSKMEGEYPVSFVRFSDELETKDETVVSDDREPMSEFPFEDDQLTC